MSVFIEARIASQVKFNYRSANTFALRGGNALKRRITISLSTFAILIAVVAFAQPSGGDFEITKNTIDNGGGTSSSGEFAVTGTIGQPDANHQISTGGGFAVSGGFWANATVIDLMFKDSFEND